MAKGAESKKIIFDKIFEVFPEAFWESPEKIIRIPMIENGETIQIKATLTCAKENVSAGADTAIPGTAPAITNAFDTVAEKEEVHATEEEVKLVNSLIDKLGL